MRTMTRHFATSLALMAGLLVLPYTASATDQQELSQFLQQLIEEEGLAGGIILIRDGGQDLIATSGLANRETGTPITADTRFYAASVGKMIVAAAILSAVDEGLIGLDSLIGPLLADLPDIEQFEREGPVKISQLLNHTSGLAEYLSDDFLDASYDAPETQWTVEEAMGFAYGQPAQPANHGFEYTNTNYVILGHILAQLDGSLERSLTRRIFSPAGMGASSVGLNPTTMAPAAHGYDENGHDVSALGWNSILGDGPVVTTASDLANFMHALFEERTLLSPARLAQMRTPSSFEENYGLGLVMDEDEHGQWVGHSGGYDGFEADILHNTDTGLTMVFMINGNMNTSRHVLGELVDWHLN